jgi:hypothetical protein
MEKIFHSPDTLADRLTTLGWSADVGAGGDFVVGVARRPTARI